MQQNTTNHGTLIKKLVVIVIAMFGFGFALVPLYDVFCEVTGLNGKTANEAVSGEGVRVNKERLVTVEFMSRTNQDMPWEFRPQQRRIQVHPGEVKLVNFYAKNNSANDTIGQAVPSVAPGLAAQYFNKIECFCFNRQPLEAGKETLMPLTFYVDVDLPEDISTLTLSYTMFDITNAAAGSSSATSHGE